jgi:hypothetical protein
MRALPHHELPEVLHPDMVEAPWLGSTIDRLRTGPRRLELLMTDDK